MQKNTHPYVVPLAAVFIGVVTVCASAVVARRNVGRCRFAVLGNICKSLAMASDRLDKKGRGGSFDETADGLIMISRAEASYNFEKFEHVEF